MLTGASVVIVVIITAIFFTYHREDDGEVVILLEVTLGETGGYSGACAMMHSAWIVHLSENSLIPDQELTHRGWRKTEKHI